MDNLEKAEPQNDGALAALVEAEALIDDSVLTRWHRGFIVGCRLNFDRKGALSDKQIAVLRSIKNL